TAVRTLSWRASSGQWSATEAPACLLARGGRLYPRRGSTRFGRLDVERAVLRNNQAQCLGSEIDRDLLESVHRVHPKQQRRPVLQLELFEDVRIGEHNREILEAHRPHLELANEHIVAGQLVTGYRLEHDLFGSR